MKTRFDPAPYREGLRKRWLLKEKRIAERSEQAREFLHELVGAFREIDPGVRKIVLFGSLARGVPDRENFDIDVAVRTSKYLSLVAWALKQDWKIDVVDLDEVGGTSLNDVESKGITLYEKK